MQVSYKARNVKRGETNSRSVDPRRPRCADVFRQRLTDAGRIAEVEFVRHGKPKENDDVGHDHD